MRLKQFTILAFILIVTTVFVASCGISDRQKEQEETGAIQIERSSPIEAAKRTFEVIVNTPYQNEKFQEISNDGFFSIVRVTLDLRPNSDSEWTENIADIHCKKIGDVWTCDNYIDFNLSPAVVQKTQEAVYLATQEAEFELNSIAITFTDLGVNEDSVYVSYNVTNNGKKSHKFAVQYSYDISCTKDDGTVEVRSLMSSYLDPFRNDTKLIKLDPNQTMSKTDYMQSVGGYSVSSWEGEFCKVFEVSNPRLELSDCWSNCVNIYWLDDYNP